MLLLRWKFDISCVPSKTGKWKVGTKDWVKEVGEIACCRSECMLCPYRKKRRHHERDPSQTWESWAVCANETQEPIVRKADHGLETGLSLRASLRRGAQEREDVYGPQKNWGHLESREHLWTNQAEILLLSMFKIQLRIHRLFRNSSCMKFESIWNRWEKSSISVCMCTLTATVWKLCLHLKVMFEREYEGINAAFSGWIRGKSFKA